MRFSVEHETGRTMRLKLRERLSGEELQSLKLLLSLTAGITEVKLFGNTGGVLIRYSCQREDLLKAVAELDSELLSMASEEIDEALREIEKTETARISGADAESDDPVRDFFALREYSASVSKEEEEAQLDDVLLTQAEVRHRKLGPVLKARMRKKILAEAVADAVMPMPLQLAYHVWQLIRLEMS